MEQAAVGIRPRAVSVLEDRRVFIALMVIVSAAVLWYTGAYGRWGDLDHYYQNAGDVLDGLMPYSDTVFEYPPLSLVFMIVPRVLSWDLSSFHYICAAQAYVFLAIGAWVLLRMADERIGSRWRIHVILLCLVVFSSYFLIARNDIYPTVLAIIAVRLFQKGRGVLAAAVLAAAAMTKLYPAVLLLPMLAVLIARRDWRTAAGAVMSATSVLLLVSLPFLISDPSTAFSYLTYHSDRGIQVESVAGGFLMMFDKIFPGDLGIVFDYGSDNLAGSLPDAISPYSNYILAAVLVLFAAVLAFRIGRSGMGERGCGSLFGAACAAAVMLFITFSKVYSAQYVIWVLLFLPFTQDSSLDPVHRDRVLAMLMPFGIFTVLSYTSYAEIGIAGMPEAVVSMIVMKNIFHILLTIELLRLCRDAGRSCIASASGSPGSRRILRPSHERRRRMDRMEGRPLMQNGRRRAAGRSGRPSRPDPVHVVALRRVRGVGGRHRGDLCGRHALRCGSLQVPSGMGLHPGGGVGPRRPPRDVVLRGAVHRHIPGKGADLRLLLHHGSGVQHADQDPGADLRCPDGLRGVPPSSRHLTRPQEGGDRSRHVVPVSRGHHVQRGAVHVRQHHGVLHDRGAAPLQTEELRRMRRRHGPLHPYEGLLRDTAADHDRVHPLRSRGVRS